MTCNLCGRRTTRHRLCKQCSIDKHHEGIPDPWDTDDSENDEVEILGFECGECSHEFELEANARKVCPECEYYGLIGHGVLRTEVLVA